MAGLVLLGSGGGGGAAAAAAGTTAATTTTTVVVTPPPPASPAALQINVDVNRLTKLAQQANIPTIVRTIIDTLSPYVEIARLPTARWDFLRDAAAGDALVTVNGVPIDVSIASAPGILDVEVNGYDTDLSLTISNTYLPQLPLANKRTFRDGVVAEPARIIPRTLMVDHSTAIPPPPGLWGRSDLDFFHQGWTNGQVMGSTSLAVGAAYAAAYSVYTVENEQAEAEALRKQQAAAIKRKEEAAKQQAAAVVSAAATTTTSKAQPNNNKEKDKPKSAVVPAAPEKKKAARMDVKKPVIVVRIPEEVEVVLPPVTVVASSMSTIVPSKYVVPQVVLQPAAVVASLSTTVPSKYVVPQEDIKPDLYALLVVDKNKRKK